MLGESSVGRRVFDLLRIMQLLRTEAAMPGGAKDPAGFRLRLVGRGQARSTRSFHDIPTIN